MASTKRALKDYVLRERLPLTTLAFEKLISLTPEGRHFPFPSETEFQQQVTLQNIRKYTCLVIVGISFLI
jgi:hypothetical protein